MNAVEGEELGQEETWNIAASLFFTPNDQLNVKLRAAYFENEDGAPASSLVPASALNAGPFTTNGVTGTRRTFAGELPFLPPEVNTNREQAFFDALDARLPLQDGRDSFGFDRQNLTLGGSFDYDFAENITLSGLFGYSSEDTNLLQDFSSSDASPFQFAAGNNREFRMNSQEVRLAGSLLEDRLDWSVGVSRFEQESTNSGSFLFGTPGTNNPADIAFESVETLGVFGSLGFAITDKLTLTGEARYQEDEITATDDIGPDGIINQGTFTNFLPRIILDYQVTPDTLLYASYSEGNNPGGFNEEIIALNAADLALLATLDDEAGETFGEESLDAYEIGLKSRFLDNRATIQAAAFFMQRANQQLRVSALNPGFSNGIGVNFNLNRGETDILGVELEGDVQLNDVFNIGGSFAYIDGEFQVIDDAVFENVFGTGDASGQKSPRFPRFSGSVNALLEHDFGTGLPLYLRADAAIIGERTADIVNLARVNGGAIVNLRAGLREDDYSVELFVKNATDSDVATAANRTSDSAVFFADNAFRVGLRDRRQFGIRFNKNF